MCLVAKSLLLQQLKGTWKKTSSQTGDGPYALGRDFLSSSLQSHQDLRLPQAADEKVEGRCQRRATCQSQARVNWRLSRR